MQSAAAELAEFYGDFDGMRSNIPSYDDIFPKMEAPVLRSDGGALTLQNMPWGIPSWKEGVRPITNVRNLKSGFWRNMLSRPENKCLVPVTSFCEWTGEKGSKRAVWFSLTGQPIFSFAGIWRDLVMMRG